MQNSIYCENCECEIVDFEKPCPQCKFSPWANSYARDNYYQHKLDELRGK